MDKQIQYLLSASNLDKNKTHLKREALLVIDKELAFEWLNLSDDNYFIANYCTSELMLKRYESNKKNIDDIRVFNEELNQLKKTA